MSPGDLSDSQVAALIKRVAEMETELRIALRERDEAKEERKRLRLAVNYACDWVTHKRLGAVDAIDRLRAIVAGKVST